MQMGKDQAICEQNNLYSDESFKFGRPPTGMSCTVEVKETS